MNKSPRCNWTTVGSADPTTQIPRVSAVKGRLVWWKEPDSVALHLLHLCSCPTSCPISQYHQELWRGSVALCRWHFKPNLKSTVKYTSTTLHETRAAEKLNRDRVTEQRFINRRNLLQVSRNNKQKSTKRYNSMFCFFCFILRCPIQNVTLIWMFTQWVGKWTRQARCSS